MTGFRLAKGGCSGVYSAFKPDLSTFGKIIGGGPSCRGHLAAEEDIMEQVAPSGPVYQAGTFKRQSFGNGGRFCAMLSYI